MINILEAKKQKELNETFLFIGVINNKNSIVKIKAKTDEEAKFLITSYANRANDVIDYKRSYILKITAIDLLETITRQDLED